MRISHPRYGYWLLPIITVLFVGCNRRLKSDAELEVSPVLLARGATSKLTLRTESEIGEIPPEVVFEPSTGLEWRDIIKTGPNEVSIEVIVDNRAELGSRTIALETDNTTTAGSVRVVEAAPSKVAFSCDINSIEPGQTETVYATGIDTHFDAERSRIANNEGLSVTNLIVEDALHARFEVTAKATAQTGSYEIVIETGPETAAGAMAVLERKKWIEVTPSEVAVGDTVSFTVTGHGTRFTAESQVSFGPESGIAVNSIDVVSNDELAFEAEITPEAEPGLRTMSVSGPMGQEVAVVAFDVQVLAAVSCFNDSYEVNDTISQAPTPPFPAFFNASICPGDDDYFKVYVQQGVELDILAFFSHADGDINVELVTSWGMVVASATSVTDNEFITYSPLSSGERYVHIYGANTSVENNYTLSVDAPSSPDCTDDGYEPNDDHAVAAVIPYPASFQAMLCPNDDDFYKSNVSPVPNQVKVELLFNHEAGDLNLAILNVSDGSVIATSESQTDNEVLYYYPPHDGEFKIRVYGVAGSMNSYILNVDETGGNDTDNDTDSDMDTGTDEADAGDTGEDPICTDFLLETTPAAFSIGRYSTRLTIRGEDVAWLSEETAVQLVETPDNVFLEGCTVTTPWHISCNLTVGVFAAPGEVLLAVTHNGETLCGAIEITDDAIDDVSIPVSPLPDHVRQPGAIDAAGDNRSDFYHIQPATGDLLVFHAFSNERETMDPILRLITPEGNSWLVYEDDETPLGIDSRFVYYFASSNDYYLEVGPKLGQTSGSYDLYVYRVTHGRVVQESALDNNALVSPENLSARVVPFVIHGAISDVNDVDVYQITVPGPAIVDVAARRLGPWDESMADATLTVYTPEGQEIARNSTWYEAPTSADPRVYLDAAGVYLIQITPDTNDTVSPERNHTGFYSVNVRGSLVINEVDNRTTSEDPFIELLGPADFELTNFTLYTYDENGAPADPEAPFVALEGTTDAAGYFALFNSEVDGGEETTFLTSGAGAVVLIYQGTPVDAVQYGLLAGGINLGEGAPASVGERRTIGRGVGIDSDNNDIDFIYMADPTPRLPNDRTCQSPVSLYGEPDGCQNSERDGDETDVDCGGSCRPCPDGYHCEVNEDCQSSNCADGVCEESLESCVDGEQNQDETDVDCGGVLCPGCQIGAACNVDADCLSDYCEGGVCAIAPTCFDGIKNQDETDVDCGGLVCSKCVNGMDCLIHSDCESDFCDSGTCSTIETCFDGIQNQDETDVDCGGSNCSGCPNGSLCIVDDDCANVDCACASETCTDRRCVTVNGWLEVFTNWGTGYCVNLYIQNVNPTSLYSWEMVVNTSGYVPYTAWNVDVYQEGANIRMVQMSWVDPIPPWQTNVESFGFCVDGTNGEYPWMVSVKGL